MQPLLSRMAIAKGLRGDQMSRIALVSCLFLTVPAPIARGQTEVFKKSIGVVALPRDIGIFEARLLDNSTVRLTLKEDRLEFVTAYGKLFVPITDVRRIELGLRISDEANSRVQKALAQLGSNHFRAREEASQELLSLRDKAYPALVAASQQPDPEISRRIEKLLAQLREQVPQELLELPGQDVLHTVDSRFTGQLALSSLRVHSAQFGPLQLKLSDVRSLRLVTGAESEGGSVQPDPGTLMTFVGMTGKTLHFRVTGVSEGNLWGTGIHTLDSSLSKAAVHAGVLRPGQTGLVKVTILPPQNAYVGSAQNGVTSSSYGPFGQGSFRVER